MTTFDPGDAANFDGHARRGCGEHRTVGSHRAWCYSCAEWCYPNAPCVGCSNTVDVFGDVRDFHKTFGVPVLDAPQVPGPGRVVLRLELLAEEYLEMTCAVADSNLAQIAKEACDLIYVIAGLLAEYGIDGAAVWAEVHRSNMSKLVNGEPPLRYDGKVLKGPGFSEADIAGVLGL